MSDYSDYSYNESTRYRDNSPFYSLQLCRSKTIFLFILFSLLLFYSVANYIISYDYNFLWFYIVSIVLTFTTGAFLFYIPPPGYKVLYRFILLVVFGFTIYWLFKNPVKFE